MYDEKIETRVVTFEYSDRDILRDLIATVSCVAEQLQTINKTLEAMHEVMFDCAYKKFSERI